MPYRPRVTDNEGHWDGTHPEDVLTDEELAEVSRTGGDVDRSPWAVIVEETTGFGRDSQLWTITRTQQCADRNEARKVAFELAENYRPEHPASPQARYVYQVGFDTWLVQMPGAMRNYHFRVSAAQFVGAHPK